MANLPRAQYILIPRTSIEDTSSTRPSTISRADLLSNLIRLVDITHYRSLDLESLLRIGAILAALCAIPFYCLAVSYGLTENFRGEPRLRAHDAAVVAFPLLTFALSLVSHAGFLGGQLADRYIRIDISFPRREMKKAEAAAAAAGPAAGPANETVPKTNGKETPSRPGGATTGPLAEAPKPAAGSDAAEPLTPEAKDQARRAYYWHAFLALCNFIASLIVVVDTGGTALNPLTTGGVALSILLFLIHLLLAMPSLDGMKYSFAFLKSQDILTATRETEAAYHDDIISG